MSKHRRIFLTGVTGFVGSHLAYRFLKEGNHLSVVARSSRTNSSLDRAAASLRKIASSEAELRDLMTRLQVLEGDISHKRLGFSEDTFRRLASSTDEVWHCAASLSFLEEDRQEIFRVNLDGTANVLKLVRQTAARRLHHVSTAYIAGKRTDLVLEKETFVGQQFKNPYEESKCKAELLIQDAQRQGELATSIYRPSIVIGDSRSGRVTHFHGVYGFIRGLWTAIRRLQTKGGGGLINLPLRVLGGEKTTLNFVPIDYVIDAVVAIGQQSSSIGGIYHVSNPRPTENHFWLRTTCEILGVQGIQFVGETSFLKVPMTRLEALFHKQMSFYYQYLCGEPRFDCRHALDALKNTSIECPQVTVDFVRRMMGWYVDFLSGKIQEESLSKA